MSDDLADDKTIQQALAEWSREIAPQPDHDFSFEPWGGYFRKKPEKWPVTVVGEA